MRKVVLKGETNDEQVNIDDAGKVWLGIVYCKHDGKVLWIKNHAWGGYYLAGFFWERSHDVKRDYYDTVKKLVVANKDKEFFIGTYDEIEKIAEGMLHE